jgi:hypothetical protein
MSIVTELSAEQIARLEEPVVWELADVLPSARPQLRVMRPLSAIRRIVVHIDDQYRPAWYSPSTRYFGQAIYHINRNWQENPSRPPIYGFGLMYHYKLSYTSLAPGEPRVARIWRVQPETLVTWHASSWNRSGLAICIDSSASQAPEEEILAELHRWLMWQCYRRPEIPAGRRDVYGHTEEPSTTKSCPAKYLPWVQRFRKGEW